MNLMYNLKGTVENCFKNGLGKDANMPKRIRHYADIAVELAVYHEKMRKALLDEGDSGKIKLERFVYETEVDELRKVFLADYKDHPEIQGSFHDFITEIQITPGNYQQSYRELMERIPEDLAGRKNEMRS